MNDQIKANEEVKIINNAAEENLKLLEKAPREPKKEKFVDGEFVIPATYKCTKCGKVYHVARQTAINRINKQYGGSMKKWLAEAVCSDCKAEAKLEAKIQELQAKKAAKEQVTVEETK